MNARTKRVGTVASAVAAVGLIVGGAWGIGAAVATPEPEPTSVVEPANFERPAADFEDVRPDVTPTPTPEPTEAAPVVEPAPLPPSAPGRPQRFLAEVAPAALEAVANPSRTKDLYFVADGTGGHVFAETLEEHNENVARWREIEKKRQQEAEEAAKAAGDGAGSD